MTPTALICIAMLGVGLLFGWSWGYTRGKAECPLPHSSGDWREGYVAGYDDARQECLRVARAHDFNTIEMQLTRMEAKP